MAYFRSRLQIFGLLSLNKNNYNPFLWQQSRHYVKSVCSKKNINRNYNERSISTLSRSPEHYESKKKMRFLSFQRASSTKRKQRKLTIWEYVFGSTRSSKNPRAYQPVNCQEQTRYREENSRQATPVNVLVYTDLVESSKDSRRLVEPQPKPPPSYKPPRAVLLNRTMMEGFAEKDDTCEGKMVTPTASRRPYEEMKPASNTVRITEHRENVRSEDVKLYEKSASHRALIPINAANARDATAKILRQAMVREEPRMHSRIEQLKILVRQENDQVPIYVANRFGA